MEAKDTVMTIGKLLDAPCVFCGYNGAGYWQVATHNKKCPFFELGGAEERENNLRDIIRSRSIQAEIFSFKVGLKQGIWLFAWWKDGVQYVGTSGRTLKEAYKELGIVK